MTLRRFAMPAALLLASAGFARADEGMWTFDNFPSDRVKSAYGFAPDQAWLDHVRLGSLRLAQGCSASLVSPEGLVMTNHHCARDCAYGLSSAHEDLVEHGFTAAVAAEERRCPDLEANQLIQITDVTKPVHDATAGKQGADWFAAERAAIAQAEQKCGTAEDTRCDVVKLYGGGRYDLYRYKRYQDVRLAWFPEDQTANFGGDPDNFTYPRYDIDAAFVRIYDNGKPLATPDHLRFAKDAPAPGALVFTSGNPGRTNRLDTMAEIAFARDVALPSTLLTLAEYRGMLGEFMRQSPEHRRMALDAYFFLANSYKAIYGIQQTLLDPGVIARKMHDETALRERVARDPKLAADAGAWDAIAAAVAHDRTIHERYVRLEQQPRFLSPLLRDAVQLVRAASEQAKPNGERLRGYTDGALPALRQNVLSAEPIYPELETVRLGFWLRNLRERLGTDDPATRALLGDESPEALGEKLATQTALRDPAARKVLLEGGAAAVAASTDPLVVFVRDRLDAPARAVLKDHQDAVEAIETRNATLIALARFALDGTSDYPDATFTPRLSFGTIRGYDDSGRAVPPQTTFAGAFAHETGADPFDLPKSWHDAKDALELDGVLDMASDNDIVGGNSGSPLIDRDGRAVGLIFDGNIQSLGADYTFDPATYRAVSVSTAAIMQALTHIYHADRIAKELSGVTD